MIQEIYECRYCLTEGAVTEMIKPCNCEGSLKYVHPQCLKAWIKYKHVEESLVEENRISNQFITNCEICNYKIKYFTEFENNIAYAIAYTVKDVLCNLRNFPFLLLHIVLLYLFYSRISFFIYESFSILKKKIKTKLFMKLGSELAIVFSFSYFVNEYIFKFYLGIYYEKRNEIYHFTTNVEMERHKKSDLLKNKQNNEHNELCLRKECLLDNQIDKIDKDR